MKKIKEFIEMLVFKIKFIIATICIPATIVAEM